MKKSKVIKQLQKLLEGTMGEWIATKSILAYRENELKETEEALNRCRNQLASYKELSERLTKQYAK